MLCPTCWTVRADALKSILDNCTVLQELWELSYDESNNTEIRTCIQRVAAQMNTFEFYYASSLAEMILRHTDKISKTLKWNDVSAAEWQEAAHQVKETLHYLCGEMHASSFRNVSQPKQKQSMSLNHAFHLSENGHLAMKMVMLLQSFLTQQNTITE